MSSLTALVTGGAGLLGQYLNRALAERFHVVSWYHAHPRDAADYDGEPVDFNEESSIEEAFERATPDVVVHTAAISSVGAAETQPRRYVYDVNVRATERLALLCELNGARMIYTSTDLVYAGDRGSFLDESSKISSLSIYAETKYMGEEKIRRTVEDRLVLRLALLYGFGLGETTCHFETMYHALREGERPKLFTDQWRTPLALHDAARMIAELAANPEATGKTINLGGKERLSRYELGERLCDLADLNAELLEPTRMSDVPDLPQVADVSMSIEALRSLGVEPKSVEESIRDILGNNY
jgi:dTDP-4-dehydrorhamnose reductase